MVGENGAGKSSLMNVLYGLYRPDAGEVQVEGRRVTLRSPRDAIALGIGMVHQHFMLVPPLTVAENVVLGREPRRRGLLDSKRANDEVAATCRRFGFTLDPRARVEDLSVGSQQKVEIVKALHRGARVLILDEPTAVLTPQEADELFKVARQLATRGHTVVLISHRLQEVLQVASRIAVMRRGRKAGEVAPADTTPQALAELMVGTQLAQLGAQGPEAPCPPPALPAQEVPLLQTVGLRARRPDGTPALRGVELRVEPGEIVGVAGVDGNGQRELALALTGLLPAEGSVRLRGEEVLGLAPGALRERGVGHVPEDRLHRAMVGPMTLEENLALGRHRRPPYARGVLIDFAGRRAEAERLLAAYDVRPPDPQLRIRELSGGNQQKVVLARELDAHPLLLVVVQPTRGLDVAAVSAVHERLRQHRAAGNAVLLVSLDLDEVLALSDRLYVLFEGRVTGELGRAEFDERRIGRLMLGAAEAVHG